jgi:hypothetical protein
MLSGVSPEGSRQCRVLVGHIASVAFKRPCLLEVHLCQELISHRVKALSGSLQYQSPPSIPILRVFASARSTLKSLAPVATPAWPFPLAAQVQSFSSLAQAWAVSSVVPVVVCTFCCVPEVKMVVFRQSGTRVWNMVPSILRYIGFLGRRRPGCS